MRDLHILPKFSDRWTHLYLEHGKIDKDASSLAFHDQKGTMAIPIDQLGLLMLGPGTRVTQAAMEILAENNCLVCWTGEQGVRLYAHSTGGTHSSFRLLRQARLYSDEALRLQVVRRMYQKRFPDPLPEEVSLQQIRGMEGARVRASYQRLSAEFGVPWSGRNYDQDNWDYGDPVNRALSSANSCLYGLCHAAILSAGYSPAIGFVHTGKMLSFVYDVADLYKTETVVLVAFKTVKESAVEVERRVRIACRDLFFETRLMQRILPDIAEVLDARDDLGESPGELDGRAVTLADPAQDGHFPWQPERAGAGRVMGDGDEEGGTGLGDPDLE
ncbi:MAG: type I-E CRISPR-associated endonuclease Cas1 [Chloroflexi bacterium]|nr:type I-E CRISPR-associated endonuclease Cas1 [Chloroflexota bacterium]